MTRTFSFTFEIIKRKEGTTGRNESDWYLEKVTLKKRVTDKMEDREQHKPGYAANYFNNVMRTQYGFKKSICRASSKRFKELTMTEEKRIIKR